MNKQILYTICSYCLLSAQPNNDQDNLVFIVNTRLTPFYPCIYTPNLIPRGKAEPILMRVGEMLNTETTTIKKTIAVVCFYSFSKNVYTILTRKG